MDRTLPFTSWPFAPWDLKLEENEVHVLLTSLKMVPLHMRSLKKILSSDEKNRAENFHFQRDRDHYIAARGMLREIIGLYLKKNPAKLKFKYNDFGKPFLEN